MDLADFS